MKNQESHRKRNTKVGLFRAVQILMGLLICFFTLQSVDATAATVQYKHLLLIYSSTNVDYDYSDPATGVTEKRHFTGTMGTDLINALEKSFQNLPFLCIDGSAGVVTSTADIVEITRPITSITSLGNNNYMLRSEDVQTDLEQYAPKCRYDSVSVIWNNGPIGGYWGLGRMYINDGTTTFSSLLAGQTWWWGDLNNSYIGEPFLHEWLHGVCYFYEGLGYQMPDKDADGADSHGYAPSSTEGWMPYYRDLMQGKVWEPILNPPQYAGITYEAWNSATPRCTVEPHLIVNKYGTGSGTVTSSDNSINCGSVCSATYDAFVTVGLTATPTAGSGFTGWSGACSGTGACSVKMDMPFDVYYDDFSANTNKWTYIGNAYRDTTDNYVVLTDNLDDWAVGVIWLKEKIRTDAETTVQFRYKAGGGTVGADGFVMMFYKDTNYAPNCGGSLGFEGSNSHLGYGIEFDSYKGDSDPSAKHIALIKDTVTNHLAYVDSTKVNDNVWHNIKVIIKKDNGTDNIKVYVDDMNIAVLNWTGTLDRTYGGFGFAAASGAYTDGHIIDDVRININGKTATANFTLQKAALTVSKTGSGKGIVRSSPEGINCGFSCSALFNYGTAVTLTAVAEPKSVFKGWSGSCSGTGTCIVNMIAAKSVTATFALKKAK